MTLVEQLEHWKRQAHAFRKAYERLLDETNIRKQMPDQLLHWYAWRGGMPPVGDSQPIRIWWPNGIRRTYERGDHIVWRNLPVDGSVKWRNI